MEINGSVPITIIPGRLYFLFVEENFIPSSQHNQKYAFYTSDNDFIYKSFFADFGPIDIGSTYLFCDKMKKLYEKSTKPIIYFCSKHPHKKSNSAVLLCAFLQAYKPFIGIDPAFIPFRDASFGINTYPVTVLDCVRAMYHANQIGHFNFNTFNYQSFHHLNKLENGDLSWIIPKKFIAFSGPIQEIREISLGVNALLPDEYVPILKDLGVTDIVRFNTKKDYDRDIFVSKGFKHHELYYEDGSNPPDNILHSFLQICEQSTGVIAVHCKAGLGRTGTNIAAYMIKHYGYSARESIAWCRICRPGSIVGPQQQYIISIEDKLKLEGERYRNRVPIAPSPLVPISSPYLKKPEIVLANSDMDETPTQSVSIISNSSSFHSPLTLAPIKSPNSNHLNSPSQQNPPSRSSTNGLNFFGPNKNDNKNNQSGTKSNESFIARLSNIASSLTSSASSKVRPHSHSDDVVINPKVNASNHNRAATVSTETKSQFGVLAVLGNKSTRQTLSVQIPSKQLSASAPTTSRESPLTPTSNSSKSTDTFKELNINSERIKSTSPIRQIGIQSERIKPSGPIRDIGTQSDKTRGVRSSGISNLFNSNTPRSARRDHDYSISELHTEIDNSNVYTLPKLEKKLSHTTFPSWHNKES